MLREVKGRDEEKPGSFYGKSSLLLKCDGPDNSQAYHLEYGTSS